MDFDSLAIPAVGNNSILSSNQATQTVVTITVRHGPGSRNQSAFPAPEFRPHDQELDARDRVTVFIEDHTADRAGQLQAKDEVSAGIARGQLDHRRWLPGVSRSVSRRLITILCYSQLIAAGWKIAERESAIGVGPGHSVLWQRLDGRKRDDGAADRGTPGGIQNDSGNDSGCGGGWRCLRERADCHKAG
jgi:hypothetical protein